MMGLNRFLRRCGSVALILLAAGCSRLLFTAVNLPSNFDDITVVHDIAYGSGPDQKLDIYLPKTTAAGPLEVIVFFYGGRWEFGSKSDYQFVGSALAAQNFIVVIPDYAKYPAVRFPAFVEDGAKAVAWVDDHIADYNGDTHRIHLSGHSAGAHIAALLTTDAKYLQAEGKDRSQVIYDFAGLSGPYSFTPDEPDLEAMFGPPAAYPLMQANTFIDGRQPPMLLQWGLADTTVGHINIDKMVAAVNGRGGCVKVITYPGVDHAGLVGALSWYNPHDATVATDMVTFFRTPNMQKCAGPLGAAP